MNNLMEIVNSPIMWILAAITIVLIVVESIVFLRHAYTTALTPEVGLTKQDCKTAFKTGFISAIGPATSVFIVMIALVAIIGGPMGWLRMSVIGGTSTELFAATLGFQAAGGTIGQDMDLTQMTTAYFAMTTNACGWLLFITLFTGKMDKFRAKIGGKDPKWLGVFSSAASLSIFGALCGQNVLSSVNSKDWVILITLIASGVIMWLCMKIGEKHPKVNTYALGISIVGALVVAALFV